MGKQSVRVLVVGGGVGGRAAAAFLRQSGHTVALSAGSQATEAAGVYLAGNGVRVLSALGSKGLLARGVKIEGLEVRDHRGEVVASEDYREEHGREAGPVGIARGDLEAALRAACDAGEVPEATSYEAVPGGVQARGAGVEGRYDLVVAADGPRSALRQKFAGDAPFRKTQQTLLRFVSRAADSPKAGRILGEGVTAMHYPIGPGLRAVSVVAPEQEPGAALAALRKATGPAGAALLDGMVAGTLQQAPLIEGLAARWSIGSVVLLGSAAHAMHPALGQGAAMAVEDARALQIALDDAPSMADAPGAFEAMRRGRVAAVHQASWAQAEAAARKSPLAASFRGLLHRMIPSLSPDQKLHALLVGGDLEKLLSHRPDMAPLTPEARDVLRFLVKIGQVDGRFDEAERAFAVASMQESGHNATPQDLEELEVETRFRGAAEIVRPFRGHPPEFREHLVKMGVLLAAASGRITSDEHKALRDAIGELEVPRETLDRFVKEAVEANDR